LSPNYNYPRRAQNSLTSCPPCGALQRRAPLRLNAGNAQHVAGRAQRKSFGEHLRTADAVGTSAKSAGWLREQRMTTARALPEQRSGRHLRPHAQALKAKILAAQRRHRNRGTDTSSAPSSRVCIAISNRLLGGPLGPSGRSASKDPDRKLAPAAACDMML
jgi:hypothetical protein